MIPEWLEPVRSGAATITADQLSRYVPPAGSTPRQGAVLLLIGEGPDGPDLLLTERAHHMRSHPGQVSFPGGSIDPDDGGPVAAALREAQEETGLDPAGVEVFGELPQLWLPPSNFAVTTVLGWWREESPVSVVDTDEVASVLRVPIDQLLDPANRVTTVHPMGRFGPGFLLADDLLLWGFTAGIVSRLFDHVGWTRPWDADVQFEVPDWMIFGRNGDEAEFPELPAPNTSFQEYPDR
ncbi:NUDIX hydrolase [Nocardioides sp.]|uniref:NUDIX hydrolase n=1 Tax=Nocardioides sp. TaxID=35761 RepID=UPI003D0CE472